MRKCAIDHCDNVLKATARVTTRVCQACKSAFRYAERPDKGPTWVLVRHRQLLKWTDRVLVLSKDKVDFRSVGPKMKRELRKY